MDSSKGAAGPFDRKPRAAVPRIPQPLQHILASDSALAPWEARRRREAELTALLLRTLPRTLAARIRVVDATHDELVIAADAGAIAAAAKMRAPDLLAAFRRDGHEFSSIRVRVQVRIDPDPPEKRLSNHVDRATLKPLATLARDLPDGPLKLALLRLVRRWT